jgi:hypothetical protein
MYKQNPFFHQEVQQHLIQVKKSYDDSEAAIQFEGHDISWG